MSNAIVPHSDRSTNDRGKRPRIDAAPLREMVANASQTKTALVKTLSVLRQQGLLEVGATQKELREAAEHHAKQNTPYGKVVERIELNATKLRFLDIVNPFAFLWYLCKISYKFAELMYTCTQRAASNGFPLRLVIYADEMNPGNPFRPEKSRTLQCVYWAFVDWPAHVLCRTFSWLVFTTIRSSIVTSIEGGMSYICRLILKAFFPADNGTSFARGIYLNFREHTYVLTAKFVGFLCDLKGHKENLEWVGANGKVCCLTCANVIKSVRGGRGRIVGLDCYDPSRFITRTNEEVYADVDELRDLFATANATDRKKFVTQYGFNHVPNGLLMDTTLRELFDPVDHTLRDWQHTLAGDGVGNSVAGETLQFMKGIGYRLASVRTFMMQCTLPSKYGKCCSEWLKDTRLKLHTLTSFSGIILTIIPILFLYMQAFCMDDPRLAEHCELVKLLHHLIGILSTGSDKPMQYVTTLRDLVCKVHEKFVKLYRKYKPKLHHMHHIIDSIEYVGKCISCFVTERKHRTIKDIALHVFRNIEHTVITDVVNHACEQIVSGHDIFESMFLVEPRACKLQPHLSTSTKAVLECGAVSKNDVVFFQDQMCAKVVAFFIISEIYFIEVIVLPMVDGRMELRRATEIDTVFKEARLIEDSCIWHSTEDETVIRVCVPPVFFYR